LAFPGGKSTDSHPAYLADKHEVTIVTAPNDCVVDRAGTPPYSARRRQLVKDIYEVLRKKQGQLAQLGKQIEALQQAAEQLRSVAHLLDSEEEEGMGAAAGRG
jgi:hypothetical protein